MNEQTTRLTFQDILNSSVSNLSGGTSLTIADILIALFMSLICGFIITWVYKKSYQGVVYQKSFNLALLMVLLVTTGVIMVISGNLILSLGMVGALSIIRFRSAIKDPIDVVFMFWAVSVGIANGVANFKVAITTTIFISLLILLIKDRPQLIESYMLVCKYRSSDEDEVFNLIQEKTSKYAIRNKTVTDGIIELLLEVRIKNTDTELLEQLSNIDSVIDVSLMSYSNNLLDQ